ncbi:aminoglycoside phosphotransferase family protein [Devosia algicola]|uniref:Aminoglycoside phosphotransferase family protein n=1 Tax=Devosia algicola TaxID=3026418 RepID=A0ABY7YML9_9HYPH|nr:aminoglycoside phosphotransferase family protein [Devosia algicola]WDR02437.1 aminoglycoside phosphotransferase family protein [Devosia algicola]
MSSTFEQDCRDLVVSLGLCNPQAIAGVRRLTGGVASDIGVVSFADKQVCVKFALAKLNVAEDWYAPVHRGRAEYAWLQFAAATTPEATPKLFGWSDRDNGFAMEFIDGDDVYLWKAALLAEAPFRDEAVAVATVLATIHAASTAPDFDRSAFQNADDFNALRLDPYLRFTATRHPDIADRLIGLADGLYASQKGLVHGDVSPKNILLRHGKPIILDAECATMGDPAFDVAFCLNHLVLKSVHLPASRQSMLAAAAQFWQTYATRISWEQPADLDARVAALLPALMLARVDGKSPVEYLSTPGRDAVRTLAVPLIAEPLPTLEQLFAAIATGLSQ